MDLSFSEVNVELQSYMRDHCNTEAQVIELRKKLVHHPLLLLFGLLGGINKQYHDDDREFFPFTSFDDPQKFRFYFTAGIHTWLLYLTIIHAYMHEPIIEQKNQLFFHCSVPLLRSCADAVAADRSEFFQPENKTYYSLLMVLCKPITN